ncbi:MAG: 16S rRNA (cytidine(1402)-2'-O)-methyltransferase [Gemmatimonadota bacterium]|nr:16S rRNA (cytidine(1402)-2'-O)-methyltransferase [Gemmatimonadota bacterium]
MSTLYLVSTPIGNLGDFTPRAAETLTAVSRILAEDTRRSRVLADRAGSTAPLVSLHQHNERERIERILEWMSRGEDLALVSDAGTPIVSDPGGRVVTAVLAAGHDVVPIPGPSAVLAALAASGLPGERFTFLGFPDRKGAARRDLVRRIARSTETVVLFESPVRVPRLLVDLLEACGADRRVAVARELTKVHETILRGTLREAVAYYEETPPKGEVTLVVEGVPAEQPAPLDEEWVREQARELLDGGMRPSRAARELARRFEVGRNDAYRIVHSVTDAQAPGDGPEQE